MLTHSFLDLSAWSLDPIVLDLPQPNTWLRKSVRPMVAGIQREEKEKAKGFNIPFKFKPPMIQCPCSRPVVANLWFMCHSGITDLHPIYQCFYYLSKGPGLATKTLALELWGTFNIQIITMIY